MHVELLTGMTNVVRFPVERRAHPTMEVLHQVLPDIREILALADSYQMDRPVSDLDDQVDAATAEHIANQVPKDGPERGAMLTRLLDPVIARAVAACHVANDAWVEGGIAVAALRRAQTAGHYDIQSLEAQADALTEQAARRLLAAYGHYQEACGVARAVDLARRGVVWTPRGAHEDTEWLLGFEQSRRSESAPG
ncbi:MAG: hypothetical protein ABSC06_18320 [Rhodopila sp.]|jgi:hypothetical protein